MTIGQKIRYERLKRGLTFEEMADLTGISASGAFNLEHRNRPPHVDTLQKIADGLGVELVIEFRDDP